MANVSLSDVLGAPQLTGVFQAVKTGIPNVFPDGFFQFDKYVEKDCGTYFLVEGTRTVARTVAYNGPSVARQLKGVTEVPVKLIHVKENITLPMADFRSLIDPNASNLADVKIDSDKAAEIGRQVREARKNVDNLRVAALTQMFALGHIYFDGQGNLLPSSAGAKTDVDYKFPATNLNQLNPGGGNIINVSWDNPAAAIDTQLLGLKQQATRATGYPLVHAFYGKNIPQYLTRNKVMASYFIRNPATNAQFLNTGEIPNLMGLQWHPAYEAFYETSDAAGGATGTLQSLFDDDTVVFTPAPSSDWLGWIGGSYDVPTSPAIASDGLDALKNFRTVRGMFAFATITTDPPAIKMVYGDTFLPVPRVPKAIYVAKVRF